MKLKYNFVINEIGDNYIAVPAGECVIEFDGILKLNETAAFIIDKLNNETSIEELTSIVVEKFGCDKDYALQNIQSILSGLRNAGLIAE